MDTSEKVKALRTGKIGLTSASEWYEFITTTLKDPEFISDLRWLLCFRPADQIVMSPPGFDDKRDTRVAAPGCRWGGEHIHDRSIRSGFVATMTHHVESLPAKSRMGYDPNFVSHHDIEESYILLNIRAELLVVTVRYTQEITCNPMHQILKVQQELQQVLYKYPKEDAVKSMFASGTTRSDTYESSIGLAIIDALVRFAEQTQARRLELLKEDAKRIAKFKEMAQRIA
jgi:hypothetical protein